jgi:hypothetical protein
VEENDGGMPPSEARELKPLREENAKLKRARLHSAVRRNEKAT